jgi:hypothetical protein
MSGQFEAMLALVERLKKAGIYHEVASYREGALSIVARVPGQYWEIDFLEDGTVDVERFVSSGKLDDANVLDELISSFSDEQTAASPTAAG